MNELEKFRWLLNKNKITKKVFCCNRSKEYIYTIEMLTQEEKEAILKIALKENYLVDITDNKIKIKKENKNE